MWEALLISKTVMCYSSDRPKETCTAHTDMLYCTEGQGVSNEYCLKFAAIGAATVETKALVKLMPADFEALKKAMKHGLREEYYTDNYVYLLNANGGDGVFTGFTNSLSGNTTPYKVCKIHTAQSWAQHQIGGGGGSTTEPTE